MARQIETRDIPRIRELLQRVLGVEDYTRLERLGGLTNRTYKTTLENGEIYVVRIPGEGTGDMICRADEKISTTLACSLGVDAPLLYFGDGGEKVSRYIPKAQTLCAAALQEPERIAQAAELLRRVHTCGIDTKVPFQVFSMAESYEGIIKKNGVPMYADYPEIKEAVAAIRQSLPEPALVPCHNDPLCENWVQGADKLYLLDWEYAGMNDPMWDLADVSIEAGYTQAQDNQLLESYLQRKPTGEEQRRFLANKIYVDYLWTLWAKTRVPYDGQPMEDWAAERYARLKGFLAEFGRLEAAVCR